MSDEPSDPSDAPATARPKAPALLLGLIAINICVSAIAVFLIATKHAEAAPAAHAPSPPSADIKGPLEALDPLVVNLDDPSVTRYLKVALQVELQDAEAAHIFEQSKTLIVDALIGYLSSLTVEGTLGAENKDHIRAEIERRVAELIGADRVRRVIFTDFVVQ